MEIKTKQMKKIKGLYYKLMCRLGMHKVDKQVYFVKKMSPLAFSHVYMYQMVTDEVCLHCGKVLSRKVSRPYTKSELLKMHKEMAR